MKFTIKVGDTIESKFFGPMLKVKVTRIDDEWVELSGRVPANESYNQDNATVLLARDGGRHIVNDRSDSSPPWKISAEKGDAPDTAIITLSK